MEINIGKYESNQAQLINIQLDDPSKESQINIGSTYMRIGSSIT